MTRVASGSLGRQLGALFEGGSAAGLSDRQLLERLTSSRGTSDEVAFAAIVARHGPMVLGVCRQLLGDHHHAEDAFQAVFLVLARQARSIRDPERLAAWLYGVAVRTARKARGRVARNRRVEEQGAVGRPEARPAMTADPVIDREQAEALHAEIERLPEAFRQAVVACYFEGLSPDEAAARLKWSSGTLRSRLVRAREKLRAGLTRRGVMFSAAALEARPSSVMLPAPLYDATTRAAMAFAGPASELAREVLMSLMIHRLCIAATAVLLLGVAAGAGAVAAWRPSVPGVARSGEVTTTQAAPRPEAPPNEPGPARMFVVGRVLDPDGKPVHGAVVDVYTWSRGPQAGPGSEAKDRLRLLGQDRSDGEGRYRLDAPRTASTRVHSVLAVAAAPGYGLGWAELNPDAERPGGDIRLFPEQTVRVRLVDVTGAPARGVEVSVSALRRSRDDDHAIGFPTGTPDGLHAWPRSVRSDDQGRIAIPGIGRGLEVVLEGHDLRYASQSVLIDAGERASDREVTRALQPARIIEGRVLDADTRQPIPGAVIRIVAGRGPQAGGAPTQFRADAEGRFIANPSPGEYFRVSAYAPGIQPYLVPQVSFAWPKGAVRKELDIAMPRGILIRGRVTDADDGRPLAGSSIQYIPVGSRGGGIDSVLSGWQAIVNSRDDGSFTIAVPPGKGHLLVFGPTGDYVLDTIDSDVLSRDRPGGRRYRAHAIIAYDVKAGEPPRDADAALRPGATVRARVEGPDGRVVAEAFVLTTLRADANSPFWRGLQPFQIPVRDGRLELHGLDPRGSARIHILDLEHEWGATVDVDGRQAGGDLVIRLQPCGRASGRFVGPGGRPVAQARPLFEFVATPGRPMLSRRDPQRPNELIADADSLGSIDPKHYGYARPRTDAEGRFTMVALIPGALYRIVDQQAARGVRIRKEFTARPGETVDLGDILIERPSE